jgi:Tfp pilus assembly protein PilO
MTKNLFIIILSVVTILSVSYSFVLHSECDKYKDLSSHYSKQSDSLKNELILKIAKEKYNEAKAEAVYAQAKVELEEAMRKNQVK